MHWEMTHVVTMVQHYQVVGMSKHERHLMLVTSNDTVHQDNKVNVYLYHLKQEKICKFLQVGIERTNEVLTVLCMELLICFTQLFRFLSLLHYVPRVLVFCGMVTLKRISTNFVPPAAQQTRKATTRKKIRSLYQQQQH